MFQRNKAFSTKSENASTAIGLPASTMRGSRPGARKSLYNQHVSVVRAIFTMAVNDRLMGNSPATGVKQMRRDKPIRSTPSLQEFHDIIANVRAQLYNADSADSADFLELLGLAGL